MYTGDLNDKISVLNEIYQRNTIYAGAGNDIINSNANYTYMYGQDGNDQLLTSNSTFQYVYGQNGDDIIDIYDGIVEGGEGNDTIIIDRASGSTKLYGNGGDDTFTINGGRNGFVDGGEGTNTITDKSTGTMKVNVDGANAYLVKFAKGETKNLNINGINYEVTNNNGSSINFIYSYDSSGVITFSSASKYFKIVGDENAVHNVVLMGTNTEFYGGKYNDNIAIRSPYITVFAGAGDDTITMGSVSYAYISGDEGNDNISVVGSSNYISGGKGNDTITFRNAWSSMADGGEGDDNIQILEKGNKTIGVIGGSGNNTLVNNADDTMINGFGTGIDNAQIVSTSSGEVDIAGTKYTISNYDFNYDKYLMYSHSDVTGQTTFHGVFVKIKGENTKTHNLEVRGGYIKVDTGDLDDTVFLNNVIAQNLYTYGGNDTVTMTGSAMCGYIYTGDGNDNIDVNLVWGTIEAGNGDDTITISKCGNLVIPNGGDGNDTYNINVSANITDTGGDNIYNINTDNASVSGSTGNDTFYVNGNNTTRFSAAVVMTTLLSTVRIIQ